VQSFENYSSLANNAQNARAGIPRPPNDNSIGNVAQGEQQRVYFVHSEVMRVATNILKQLNTTGYSLGGSAARDLRGKAFAEFLRGASLGYLAMVYDSAAVVHEGLGGAEPGNLVGYAEVRDSAFAALQRSIDFTTQSGAVTGVTDGFPLPGAWIPGPTSMTTANFIRLVRSYRARFRAGVARTPAERADISAGGLVDWNAVILDSQNGITADHLNTTNTTTGPFKTWVSQYHGLGNWHQMSPFIIGMADTTGSYAAWIAEPLASRGAGQVFFMSTPDLRFPQGASRAAQQADHVILNCEFAATVCKRYFRNRPSTDDNTSGLAWGSSQYDFLRYWSWFKLGDAGQARNGNIVFFTKAELDMLEAEGHMRKAVPDYTAAAGLINLSRTRGMSAGPPSVATGGGLPAITVFNGTAPVPGGNACVPKMPVNAVVGGGGTVTCGTMMEAMKWEKRVETAYTHFAPWFFDHRGWGDLAEGTPLHWAPPYQDLQARSKAIYSTGFGTTGGASAALGTYGW
jgi:hypothetical protein